MKKRWYFSLRDVKNTDFHNNHIWIGSAENRAAAIVIASVQVGATLSLDEQPHPPRYMMAEWLAFPHDPPDTIPQHDILVFCPVERAIPEEH